MLFGMSTIILIQSHSQDVVFSDIRVSKQANLRKFILSNLFAHLISRYLESTYGSDYLYRLPFDQSQGDEREEVEADKSSAYKKCNSQFTDTADYRRSGVNTWQNESGLYENSELKKTVFKSTNPIPERNLQICRSCRFRAYLFSQTQSQFL